jgi:hypothetical protein
MPGTAWLSQRSRTDSLAPERVAERDALLLLAGDCRFESDVAPPDDRSIRTQKVARW